MTWFVIVCLPCRLGQSCAGISNFGDGTSAFCPNRQNPFAQVRPSVGPREQGGGS